MARTINNAWMWARNNRRCDICGQYFEDGDEYIMSIGAPANKLAHRTCYDANLDGRNADEMREWIHARKRPAARNAYREDAEQTSAVVKVITDMFGWQVHHGPQVIRFMAGRRKRTVASYNRKFGCIRFDVNRGGILDRFFLRSIRDKIANGLREAGIEPRFDI